MVSKRRNGTSGASDPPVNAFAELASFDHLLKQHGLDSGLDTVASTAPPPALAGSDPSQDRKQQTFALLDTLYESLRDQVQNDLDHP